MKLAIMQPYFFPYLGYFQLIQAVDKFVLYSHCQYTTKSWVNRNRIAQRNTAEPFLLTVPVKKCALGTAIKDVQIQYQDNQWQRVMVRQIALNYRHSPYFDAVFPVIEDILAGHSFKTIAELNGYAIRLLAKYLSISTIIEEDSMPYKDIEECLKEEGIPRCDLSQYFVRNLSQRSIRILEICKRENCTHYFNAPGGQSLYRKEDFMHYGIDLRFVQMNEISYPSIAQTFIPSLSIIDVLMQNGWERTREMLDCYTLV